MLLIGMIANLGYIVILYFKKYWILKEWLLPIIVVKKIKDPHLSLYKLETSKTHMNMIKDSSE